MASNETPASIDLTYVEAKWDDLFAEVAVEPHLFGWTFTVDTVPDYLYRPIAWLLAVQIAPHYNRPAEDENAAWLRLYSFVFPDDRDNYRDYDDDGTVSDSEAAAAKRAVFY